MTVKDKAAALHQAGFNCAQSVLGALEDKTGLDRDTAMALAAGFGGGVRCGEICGAVSGSVMAIGLCAPFTEPENAEAKNRIAELTKEFDAKFVDNFGCVRCVELKRSGHGCPELIAYAAELAEKMIDHNKQGEDR